MHIGNSKTRQKSTVSQRASHFVDKLNLSGSSTISSTILSEKAKTEKVFPKQIQKTRLYWVQIFIRN